MPRQAVIRQSRFAKHRPKGKAQRIDTVPDTAAAKTDPLGLSRSVRVQITGCPDTPAQVEARPPAASDAQWMVMRLAQAVAAFEAHLDADHEVGFSMVSFGAGQVLRFSDLGFWAPDLVLFYGRTDDGAPIQLIEHVSQVNVMLVAARKATPEPPRRIGFDILRKAELSAT
jgi:hypothetical protein